MVKTVFTEQDKRDLMRISLELLEIRKLVDQLAETMVNLSDKELLKAFNASQNDIKEKQIDRYTETLEKQIDIAEKEFQPI